MEDKGIIDQYIALAKQGTKEAIDQLMTGLNVDMTLAESKFIDYALGYVENEKGIEIMADYLFNGTQIQRNYCALYFGRMGEYPILRKAYEKGLIDGRQAFSR